MEPTEPQIEKYIAAIADRYPICGEERVWCACDGLKLNLAKSTNWAVQNRNFNGWTHGDYINGVFVFAPDGKIKMSLINAPGTWHDSTMAEYGIYQKMESVYNRLGGKVVVDSAFSLANKPFIIKSSDKKEFVNSLGEPDCRAVVLNAQALSLIHI